MATDKKSSTKVVTGKVRLSYVHLHTPVSQFEGQDPRYSCVILVPKSDKETIRKIKAAQKAALEQGKASKWNGSIPKNWSNSFRDGDAEEEEDARENNPEYAGHYFMSIGNKMKPGIVDLDREKILDPTEVYSGCYARVSMNAFPYNVSGNKGVSFGLNHVQKVADGDPLGNITRAEDDFDDDFEGEDEDDDDLI